MEVKHRGLNRIILKFERMRKADKWLGETLNRWGKDVLYAELYGQKNYAPPTLGTYERSGKLGHGHKWRMIAKLAGAFTNDIPYRIYVIGDAFNKRQAWMHRGRWWRWRDRILNQIDSLSKRGLKRIMSEWKRG